MDHLPLPVSPAHPHISVPYTCTEAYDGLDFEDYPLRMGWPKHRFGEMGFWSQQDPKATTSFLQTWLFFGLLEAFLDIPIDVADFVNEEPSGRQITMQHIRMYVLKWHEEMDARGHDYRLRRMECINDCIAVANSVAGLFKSKDIGLVPDVLDAAVALSIQILGRTLLYFADEYFQSVFGPDIGSINADRRFEHSELVVSRAVAAGWCPNQISRFTRLDSQYFASCINRHWEGRTHNGCTTQQCLADNIDEETYQTQHFDCPESHKCVPIGPPTVLLQEILRRGQIPVIMLSIIPPWSCTLAVRPVTENIEYTALSHVWADGLGNSKGNSLNSCQFLRLYLLACPQSQRDLFATNRPLEAGHPVFLWIDTLCVPVEKRWRKVAIQRMGETYEKATKTFVIDRELQQTCSIYQSYAEICARIRGSRWMSRVWTFQEAMLSRSLWIVLKERSLNLDTLEALVDDAHAENRMEQLVLRCADFLHPRTHRTASDADRFIQAWNGFATRTTSRCGDESICLASVLHVDTTPLVDLPPGPERLKALVQQLDRLPAQLLFAEGPRVAENGFRWLPLSLLGYKGHAILVSNEPDPAPAATRTDKGLLLSRPGILFGGSLFDEQRPHLFRIGHKWFYIMALTEAWNEWSWTEIAAPESSHWAFVFKNETWDSDAPQNSIGIIVSVQRSSNGVNYCNYKCLGGVTPATAIGMENGPVRLRPYFPTQNAFNAAMDAAVDQGRTLSCTYGDAWDAHGHRFGWLPTVESVQQDQLWCIG